MLQALEVSFIYSFYWFQCSNFESAMHKVVAIWLSPEISNRVDQQARRNSNTSWIHSSLPVLVLHLLDCEQDAVDYGSCAGRFLLLGISEPFNDEFRSNVVQHVVVAASKILRKCSNVVVDRPFVAILQRLIQEQVEEVGADCDILDWKL
jgi:hypothetical protein